MTEPFETIAEAICAACGARCCHGAHPPLSPGRISLLLEEGIPACAFESPGYTRMRSGDDGICIMCSGGRCRIHAVKPETCTAGPFTFDVTDHTLRIFIKKETICPLVCFLKGDRAAYDTQYRMAVESLTTLVRSLPAPELDVINMIPEPETDLVAEIPLTPGGGSIA